MPGPLPSVLRPGRPRSNSGIPRSPFDVCSALRVWKHLAGGEEGRSAERFGSRERNSCEIEAHPTTKRRTGVQTPFTRPEGGRLRRRWDRANVKRTDMTLPLHRLRSVAVGKSWSRSMSLGACRMRQPAMHPSRKVYVPQAERIFVPAKMSYDICDPMTHGLGWSAEIQKGCSSSRLVPCWTQKKKEKKNCSASRRGGSVEGL